MGTEVNNIVVTERDSSVTVKKGDILTIKLPEQAGTAFSWTIVKNDESILQPKGASRIEPTEGQPKVGGSVVRAWDFAAIQAGMATIAMQYSRPFDKNRPAAKTYQLTVKVE